MDNKALATFLVERDGAIGVLYTLLHTESRTIDELIEDLDFTPDRTDFAILLSGMVDLGLIKLSGSNVVINEKGQEIMESLLKKED